MERERSTITTDIVIDYRKEGLVLIKRGKDPYKDFWALPGGHLEVGVYSDPLRDPRGHYVSVVYFTSLDSGDLKAQDDAIEIAVFNPRDLLPSLAFDHKQIIEDYLRRKNNGKAD